MRAAETVGRIRAATLPSGALAAALLLAGGIAFGQSARRRVVLVEVQTPAGRSAAGRVRRAVEAALSGSTDVVSEREWREAVRGRNRRTHGVGRVPPVGPDEVGRVAQQLDVDAVLEASVERMPAGDFTLVVAVRNGNDGDLLDRLRFSLPPTQSLRSIEPELRDRLGPLIARTSARLPSVRPVPAGPRDVPTPSAQVLAPAPSARAARLRAALWLGFVSRTFELVVPSEMGPRRFAIPAFAASGIEAEVAPLAAVASEASGLIVRARYARSWLLQARGASATQVPGGACGSDVSIDAAWQTYSVDLGYQREFEVAGRALSPTVTVGYGALATHLWGAERLCQSSYLASSDDRFVSTALYATYDVVPRWKVRLGLGLALLWGLAIGDAQKAAFGNRTAGGSGWSLSLAISTRHRGLPPGLVLGLAAELLRYAVRYEGAGDPVSASESSDLQFRLALTAAMRLD